MAKLTSVTGLQALVDSYTIHDTGSTKPPTLMEIAGFPHWENVFSNILAFLTDANQAHGFGTLFIRALIAAYRQRSPDGWSRASPGRKL